MSSTETKTVVERKQRRRSSLEQSNRNKNGVLEWTAWTRDGSFRGLNDQPKPVKRESIHSNLQQSWIGEDADDGEEPAKRRATKTHTDNWEELSNDSDNNGKNMYGFLVAAAVTVVAVGLSFAMKKAG